MPPLPRSARILRSAVLAGGLAFLVALATPGCGGSAASAPPPWLLSAEVDGAPNIAPLHVWNVYLYDNSAVPEDFEFLGEGIALVGRIPKDLSVGYAENWEKLLGKSLPISRSGGDPRARKESYIEFTGHRRWEVRGGEILPEKLSGSKAGSEGDRTLSGRLRVRVLTPLGEKTIEGTFAIQVVSWG